MRHNLTNISLVDINSVDHFYVVGSTTKEGLIEGKSNVKVDLKDAVSTGGKEAFTSSLKEMLATIPDMVWYPKLDALWEFDGEDITGNVNVSVGDELTLEELFYADDYNVLRIYMYLLTVVNTVPKNLSLGSGAPNRILGGYDNNRIYFSGNTIEDSPIPYKFLYMMTLVDWPQSYDAEEGYEREFFWIHPNNEDNKKIGFFYNRDTETCKVISISQQQ